MSGAFGWHQKNDNDTTPATPGFFGGSRRAAPSRVVIDPASRAGQTSGSGAASTPASQPASSYQAPAPRTKTIPRTQARLPTPDARHAVSTDAEVALIIVQDCTGSMGEWLDEIFRRLPLLYHEACEYFDTDDLEILFIAHGDAYTDLNAVQVARFGKGQELDTMLASFDRNSCGGGGQGTESQELVAYYILKQVDTSRSQHVYAFFITDEAGSDRVDGQQVRTELGLTLDTEFERTDAVFAQLMRRMNLYTVLFDTTTYYGATKDNIGRFWNRVLGRERILPLNDGRRVVDVMLAVCARLTGQFDRFTQNMRSRQAGSHFADVNMRTVQQSVALVGGNAPKAPQIGPGTRPLLLTDGNDD